MNRIGDYALIGDCHSAALVGKDGAIDWACFPRFDSPATFCRMLDRERGGTFQLLPNDVRETKRRYLDGTNVLITTFSCARGEVELIDCMPVERLDPADPSKVRTHHSILRKLRCTAGEVDVELRIEPRFEYGAFIPRFRVTSETTAEIVGGADALWITATHPLEQGQDVVTARWSLRPGEEAWIEAAWSPSFSIRRDHRVRDHSVLLDATVAFWRAWVGKCWYDGDQAELVHRSALTLKALTFAPSGALVAAPTTSLPEDIGGIRNWDYRYTWIRDSVLTLTSLFILGFSEEADNFKTWLERAGAGRPQDLQIMYGVGGERALPERVLEHLSGHRGSAPVRIGNAAVKQMQLDTYGEILQAAYLYDKAQREFTPDNLQFLVGLADITARRWHEPDQGIWEMRDAPRHFIHSKLNCWAGLDRCVRLGKKKGFGEAVTTWATERDRLARYVLTEGAPRGWFQQAADVPVPDAATLLVPALGLLPTNHPLVRETMSVVTSELTNEGLVHRYHSSDGLVGGEGAFLLCSFWMLDCLTHCGRLDEADRLFDRLRGLANDVGLYAEEADPVTGEAVGNFPQAFTHMALVLSAAHLSAAKRGHVPFDGAHDYSELALDRLLRRELTGAPAGH